MKNIILIVLLCLAGWHGYQQYQMRVPGVPETVQDVAPPPARHLTQTSAFKCDGRTYCSQMTSCAEATYFLQNCPGTKMDGNNDGVPCEKQWCN